jgi:DNA-binding NarL/FixJ family response regulator
MLRDGIRMILEAQHDLQVVGEAESGSEAVALCVRLRPQIAVLDIAMPGLNGLEAAQQIGEQSPGTRVIILSMHEGEEYLREALRAGVAGYVLTRAAATELVNAIRAVSSGDAYLAPSLTRTLIGGYMRGGESPRTSIDELTERELDVLKLVAEGMTNRQIALELNISIKTVQSHRTNIMEKLDLHDRTELVRYAIRRGLIKP